MDFQKYIAIIVSLHNPYQLIMMIYNNVNRGPCPIQGNEIGLTWLMFIDRLISNELYFICISDQNKLTTN